MGEISLTSSITGLVSGAVGGVCNVCIGHPFDLVKVRQQMSCTNNNNNYNSIRTSTTTTFVVGNSSSSSCSTLTRNVIQPQHYIVTQQQQQQLPPSSLSTFRILSTIIRQDGISGLYAGVTAPLIAVIPAFAVSFASYEFAKTYIQQYYTKNTNQTTNNNDRISNSVSTNNNHQYMPPLTTIITQSAVAGGFSGILLGFIVGPTERIKCLMQIYPTNPKYITFQQTVSTVYKQGGIPSLFRGTLLTICRDVPGNAVYFGTYEYIKHICTNYIYNNNNTNKYQYNTNQKQHLMIVSTAFAGGMAGIVNWIVAIPIDVVKSKWQVSEFGQYKNVQQIIYQLYYSKNGIYSFFTGLSPALLRAFPANAACFLAADTVKRYIFLE